MPPAALLWPGSPVGPRPLPSRYAAHFAEGLFPCTRRRLRRETSTKNLVWIAHVLGTAGLVWGSRHRADAATCGTLHASARVAIRDPQHLTTIRTDEIHRSSSGKLSSNHHATAQNMPKIVARADGAVHASHLGRGPARRYAGLQAKALSLVAPAQSTRLPQRTVRYYYSDQSAWCMMCAA